MRSDSVKNMSAYADQNHAPSLAAARLESSTFSFFYKHFLFFLCFFTNYDWTNWAFCERITPVKRSAMGDSLKERYTELLDF